MEYADKSATYEHFLARLNDATQAEFGHDAPSSTSHLSVQITGYPRSGTTLIYQLLANTKAVGYPSNIMAPYWRTPHVGAKLQHAISTSAGPVTLQSIGGRTADPLGPHEFGYFWRFIQGHDSMSLLADRQPLPSSETRRLLDLVNDAFGAPTVYKNFLAPLYVDYFAEVGRTRFVKVERAVQDVATSMLSLRQQLKTPSDRFLGPIPRHPRDKYSSTIEMVCHQISDLLHIEKDSKYSQTADCLRLAYKDICDRPRDAVAAALNHCNAEFLGATIDALPRELPYSTPFSELDKTEQSQVIAALTSEGLL